MERTSRGGSPRQYSRMARVNVLLRQVLADEIERLADADERLRLLTLTAVICEPDLRHATVYLSSLSEDAAAALDEHRRPLQATIARETRMKRVPVLAFAADPAVEAGQRVEEALRRARLNENNPDAS